jgi:DNA polymerase III subunit delta
VDLEMAIKQGYVNVNSILPFLLVITRLFQPVHSK